MEIRIHTDRKTQLEDLDNMRDFKVVADGPSYRIQHVGEALAAARAGKIEASHAWISEQWLRAQNGEAAWQEGLGKMVDYAKSKGWVDETGRIRAHIEWK